MPRFYFDVTSGPHTTTDRTGEACVDLPFARDAAMSILTSVARDEMPESGQRGFAISVRDEDGMTVFAAQFRVDLGNRE